MIGSALILAGLALAQDGADVQEQSESTAEPVPVEEAASPTASTVEQSVERILSSMRANGYAAEGTGLALLELEKTPEDPSAPTLRLVISRVQRDLGLGVQEVQTLSRGLELHPNWGPWFELARMDAHYNQNKFRLLVGAHEGRRDWDPRVIDAAQYYVAWGQLAVGNERGAQVLLSKVRGDLEVPARGLSSVLDELPVRQRSPAMASALSVLPGLGHAYGGDAAGAVGTFVLVGGLSGGAAYLYTEDENLWGTVLASLAGLAWLNGFFDASGVTVDRNRMRRVTRFEMLRDRYGPNAVLGTDQTPIQVVVEDP